jgi:hypothetical protein
LRDGQVTRRRIVIGTAGAACALAGCSDADGSGDSGANGGSDSEPTATQPATEAAAPDISVLLIRAPDEVAVGQEFTISVELVNTGTADGTFTGTFTVTTANGETAESDEFEIDVPAGETITRESDPISVNRITELTYSIGSASTSIQFVSARLGFGESYRAPTDVIATVNDVALQPAYDYQNYQDETDTESAPEGLQYAFVDVTVENASGSTEFIPFDQDFSLRVGASQYDSVYISRERGMYDGGEVGPGVIREGEIAYEVPDDLSRSELTVEWFETAIGGDYGARWTDM